MAAVSDLARRGGAAAFTTLRRFPCTIAFAVAATALSLWLVHHPGDTGATNACLRFLLCCLLGVPLAFQFTILRERLPGKPLLAVAELAAFALLAAYYFTLPRGTGSWPLAHTIRFLLLLAGLSFSAAVTPFAGVRDPLVFWEFDKRLFLHFLRAAIHAGILNIGLELALASISALFEIHFEKPYLDLPILMAGLFLPLFFLAGIPRDILALEKSYPRVLKAFAQFVLLPLVVVYSAILYAYLGKILLAAQWPRGWVAWPVLILSIFGISAAFLLYPLREAGEPAARRFFRWFFPALAPLSLLLILSFHVRISKYGITEDRYLGVLAGALILVVSSVFTVKPGAGVKWIPSSLALLCILSSFGPWSAFAVSARSQVARLDRTLQAFHLWQNGHAVAAVTALDNVDPSELHSLIGYLLSVHGDAVLRREFDAAQPILETGWAQESSYAKTEALTAWLNIRVTYSSGSPFDAVLPRDIALPVAGWRVTFPVATLDTSEPVYRFDDLQVRLDKGLLNASINDGPFQPLPINSNLAAIDLRSVLPILYNDLPAQAPRYRIYFQELAGSADNHGALKITRCTLSVLEH